MNRNRRRDIIAGYRPSIRSRHPSHSILRPGQRTLPKFPFRTVVRLGSTTELSSNVGVEINPIAAIQISSNKLRMKQAFGRADAKTAPWFQAGNITDLVENAVNITNGWESKLVCKNHYGSKGRGNTLVSNEDELVEWSRGKTLTNYLFERFMNFGHEFRLHITSEGYFYTCRKAMRRDTPEEERWHFHDSTCVWLLEENENFHKPNTWDEIVDDCVNALTEIGADILSFDVKVQRPIKANGEPREYQDYILLECNSASSLGDYNGQPSICAQKYIDELPKVITKKAIDLNLM